jgi:hypothetical protein
MSVVELAVEDIDNGFHSVVVIDFPIGGIVRDFADFQSPIVIFIGDYLDEFFVSTNYVIVIGITIAIVVCAELIRESESTPSPIYHYLHHSRTLLS